MAINPFKRHAVRFDFDPFGLQAGGADVNVALSGVSTTAAIGTNTANIIQAITWVAATVIEGTISVGGSIAPEIKSTVGGGGYAGKAISRELDRKVEAIVYGIPSNLELLQREDEELLLMLTAAMEVEEWEVLQAA